MITTVASPKKKLADNVIEAIKGMIQDGLLKEGDKLPNQTEFARQLGVSRLALREALQTLQQMGVVSQKPKIGTVITVAATERWAEPIAQPILEDADAIFELLRARKVIESAITAYAVSQATDEDIKTLELLMRKSEEAYAARDMNAYIEHDVQFHIALISVSRNRYLIHMYLTVYNKIVQYMGELFNTVPAMWDAALENHRKIFKAVAAGDVSKAVAAVEKEHDADICFFQSYYYQRDL